MSQVAIETLLPEVAELIVGPQSRHGPGRNRSRCTAVRRRAGPGLHRRAGNRPGHLQKYGFQLKSDNEDNIRIFSSLRALTTYIASQRTQ